MREKGRKKKGGEERLSSTLNRMKDEARKIEEKEEGTWREERKKRNQREGKRTR